ncbi:hypothetical protein SAMN05421788_101827 [Filimonas lacunae]|uniref:Uncharacterized protein n=2 Tax=Filimonas lacunae TaxID=477680 RepID=A0A1N7LER6_9BACT|nr:hypothetical protein SAMN05421788_101827 [Filimonas lacunae]
MIALAVLPAFSCHTSRNVSKNNIRTDSAGLSKSEQISKSITSLLSEAHSVTKSQGIVYTQPDSIKTNFLFNPADTSDVETEIETGTLHVKAKFNPKTGKGTLAAVKKTEQVTVDIYKEESRKITSSGTDSNSRKLMDSTHVTRKESSKISVSKTNPFAFIGLLLLLACLYLLYRWLKKECLLYKNKTNEEN